MRFCPSVNTCLCAYLQVHVCIHIVFLLYRLYFFKAQTGCVEVATLPIVRSVV